MHSSSLYTQTHLSQSRLSAELMTLFKPSTRTAATMLMLNHHWDYCRSLQLGRGGARRVARFRRGKNPFISFEFITE
jgi:hypothetical protein